MKKMNLNGNSAIKHSFSQRTKMNPLKVVLIFAFVYGIGFVFIFLLYFLSQNNTVPYNYFTYLSYIIILISAIISVVWAQKSAKK